MKSRILVFLTALLAVTQVWASIDKVEWTVTGVTTEAGGSAALTVYVINLSNGTETATLKANVGTDCDIKSPITYDGTTHEALITITRNVKTNYLLMSDELVIPSSNTDYMSQEIYLYASPTPAPSNQMWVRWYTNDGWTSGGGNDHGIPTNSTFYFSPSSWPSVSGYSIILQNYNSSSDVTVHFKKIVWIKKPTFATRGDGDGTSASPYLIKSFDDLKDLSVATSQYSSFFGSYYRLKNDIDGGGQHINPIGESKTLVGRSWSYSWKGIFDGNGKTISNIVVDHITGDDYCGLFNNLNQGEDDEMEYLPAAEIKNLILANSTINGGTASNVGGIIGFVNKGKLTGNMVINCTINRNSKANAGILTGGYETSHYGVSYYTLSFDDNKYTSDCQVVAGGTTYTYGTGTANNGLDGIGVGNSSTSSPFYADVVGQYEAVIGGTCGTAGHESEVTWVLTGTSPNYTLTISGSGAMEDYSYNSQPWYSYRASIASVVVNSGVTHIGDYSFYNYSALTSVTLPSSGLYSIGDNAFDGCKISSITIPSSVTNIGFQALMNCSSLSSITVDSGNDNYSSEDGVLFNKDKTRIIQYPIAKSGETYTLPATVTYIYDHAFRGCTNLTSFNVPDGVTTIGGYAFNGCTNLASVNISNSVAKIYDNAFSWCANLTSVTLNSNPSIDSYVFPSGATVTMNLAAREGETGQYWTTFYNRNYNFEAAVGTQIFKAALDDAKLTLTELGDDSGEDKIVTKNNAVILKSTASPIVLTLTTTDSGNNFDGNSLLGVTDYYGLTADGTHFVLNKGSKGVGFYKMKSGKTIGVGKAYLTYSGALAREFFGFEEETTDISTTDYADYMDKAGAWYTIDGRRLQGKPNTKGLYIVNGKKTVIK